MIPLVLALTWFISTTRAGRAMRATAQDPEAARLMGINVNNTISLTFLLGGMLAGAAGLVYALYETNDLVLPGLRGRADRVHRRGDGRHRQRPRRRARRAHHRRASRRCPIRGMGPQWTEAVVFGYLILIMILRPRGLLGEETREAG